jgi:hypothetical protein
MPATVVAQGAPNATEVTAGTRALETLPAKNGAKLTITTPAFKDGSDIPFENTQYKGNAFPGLSWTAGPSGTKSYTIIMQDTDGCTYDTMTAAMKDHVLASGELVGLGQVMPAGGQQ